MALPPAQISQFQQQLLAWYDAHARDLPWRQTNDPYCIWVSEIMLQQTRVAAVIGYYTRFLTLFPTLTALSQAEEQQVLAAWSGLGYYRRARFLHQAAKLVVSDFAGALPPTASELRKLPGIGHYTSSAIASIAFGEPVAAVDGNIERVLLRVFPPTLPQAEKLQAQTRPLAAQAAQVLSASRPGDFNQAMMELGATICLPQRPLCLHCPVQPFCATRGEHHAPPPKKMRKRQIAYALLRRRRAKNLQVMLERRPLSASLMPGMWELPEVAMLESDGERVEITLRHSITVTNYQVRVLRFAEPEAALRFSSANNTRRWTTSSELNTLPLTGLARKVLRRLQIIPKEIR